MGLINIGTNHTAPTFDDPIAMLLACHGKIRRFCDTLGLLPEYVQQHGWDDKAKQSVTQIRHYFNVAAPLHHLDEEQDLFPAFLPLATSEDQLILQQLITTHTELELTWHQLDAHLASLPNIIEHAYIQRLQDAYQQHMRLEEPMFAKANQILPQNVLQQLGNNMAQRRK